MLRGTGNTSVNSLVGEPHTVKAPPAYSRLVLNVWALNIRTRPNKRTLASAWPNKKKITENAPNTLKLDRQTTVKCRFYCPSCLVMSLCSTLCKRMNIHVTRCTPKRCVNYRRRMSRTRCTKTRAYAHFYENCFIPKPNY